MKHWWKQNWSEYVWPKLVDASLKQPHPPSLLNPCWVCFPRYLIKFSRRCSNGTETDTRASMAIGSNINSSTTSGGGESRLETCLWSHVFLLFINPLWALYGQNVQPINCNSTHNWQILVCLWVTHLRDGKLDSTSCCRSKLGAWMWTNFESSFYSR